MTFFIKFRHFVISLQINIAPKGRVRKAQSLNSSVRRVQWDNGTKGQWDNRTSGQQDNLTKRRKGINTPGQKDKKETK